MTITLLITWLGFMAIGVAYYCGAFDRFKGLSFQQALLRLICRSPSSGAPKDMEDYFQERLRESRKFLGRWDGVSFKGQTVLDFGCGLGTTAFLVAERGAAKVAGVDIDHDRIAFARSKLLAHSSGSVSFHLPEEMPDEKFDIIVSEDCFEHYDEPAKLMEQWRGLLSPSGFVIIGFGPLWKSPRGGHVGYMTGLPWAHLLFSEPVIMAERMRYRPNENARTFAEMKGGLNQMTYAKFRSVVRSSGFEIVNLRVNVSKNPVMRLFSFLRLLPFMEEFFTANVYAVVRPSAY